MRTDTRTDIALYRRALPVLADSKPVLEYIPRARPVELALHVIALQSAKPGPRGERGRCSRRVEAVVTRIPTRMYSLALKGGKINHAPFIGMLQEHNVRTGFFEDNQFEAVRAHLLACAQPVVTFAYIKASGRHGSKRASRRAAPDASCMTSGARP